MQGNPGTGETKPEGKRKKKSKNTRNRSHAIRTASGFEEFFADSPRTPACYSEEQQLFDRLIFRTIELMTQVDFTHDTSD